jgi:hypothetical protein
MLAQARNSRQKGRLKPPEESVSSRHLIAYVLLILLLGGIAAAIWFWSYNSEHNVRRRARRERRAKRQERLREAGEGSPSDSDR